MTLPMKCGGGGLFKIALFFRFLCRVLNKLFDLSAKVADGGDRFDLYMFIFSSFL